MFQIRIQIARPPQVVFAHLADVESAPRWYEAVRRVDNPSGRSAGLGTHITFHREIGGQPLVNDVEITQFAPEVAIGFTSRSGPTPFTYRYILRPAAYDAGETELTLKGEISGQGLAGPVGLLGPLAARLFENGMRTNLEALKAWVEGRSGPA